ncbi:MAG: ADP-ribosylglycohydrolase [Lentisphaerae bacterium GWF2_44_16]|nr:MAG: ADP-ribosylglycohydrolase [Lentisphaerae bacterium GWF2_44_16]HAU65888.1 ADP-ribosylglycohydrolase [Candidatus Uhrbacteria bacterium]
MIGAIIGDIVGSRYEFDNIKTKDFPFFHAICRFTDDSVMTIAVATALLQCDGDYSDLSNIVVKTMQTIGRDYPYCGYGGYFRRWVTMKDPKPYNSFGNGAPMRVSACGIVGRSIEETILLARKVTEVTHNHPEGMKAAEAVALAVFLARTGKSKKEIHDALNRPYYHLDFTLDEIRDSYGFDESSQGTTPQALTAFFESTDFEDAVRNAVSIGGDSDTVAAITGSIAAAYYGVPSRMIEKAYWYMDRNLGGFMSLFEQKHPFKRTDAETLKEIPIYAK